MIANKCLDVSYGLCVVFSVMTFSRQLLINAQQHMSDQDAANCTAVGVESVCENDINAMQLQDTVVPSGSETMHRCQPQHTEQYRLIQKIRRKNNQEVVEGRSAEDEEAIRELVT
jgi:hypothetical protein